MLDTVLGHRDITMNKRDKVLPLVDGRHTINNYELHQHAVVSLMEKCKAGMRRLGRKAGKWEGATILYRVVKSISLTRGLHFCPLVVCVYVYIYICTHMCIAPYLSGGLWRKSND